MKKTFKRILFVLLFLFTFSLTGCDRNTRTPYCTDTDIANIKQGLRTKMDDGSQTIATYSAPGYDELNSAGVIATMTSDGAMPLDTTTVVNWEYIGTLTEEQENKYKDAYVEYVYTKYYPKACLVHDNEHLDSISGGEIEKKSFDYAFKNEGLFNMLAWPFSWLFIKGAELISGNNINGLTITISMILVTFIIRGIILLCTLKSSKQQQIIQSLQPQLNAINAKYMDRNDQYSKQAKAQEMMNLYAKYNVNPASSLLTPLITLPILVAVYNAIRFTTVIFEQDIAGLSLGENLGQAMIAGKWVAILIFVLMATAQFLTMKLPQWLSKKQMKVYEREKAKGGQGQGITYFFLAMIIILAITLPAAMSIYWIASSLFSVLQTFLLNNKKGRRS